MASSTRKVPNHKSVSERALSARLCANGMGSHPGAQQLSLPPRSGKNWKGLPGQRKTPRIPRKESDWTSAQLQKSTNQTASQPCAASAHKKFPPRTNSRTLKHAPIGSDPWPLATFNPTAPFTSHAQTRTSGASRRYRPMLGTIKTRSSFTPSGAGHYGRSNGGEIPGEEDDAVISRKHVGKTRSRQWMRAEEDLQWFHPTQSSQRFADVEIAPLRCENGKISAYRWITICPPCR